MMYDRQQLIKGSAPGMLAVRRHYQCKDVNVLNTHTRFDVLDFAVEAQRTTAQTR